MKKFLTLLLCAALCLALASCTDKKKDKEKESGDDTTAKEEIVTTAPIETVPNVADDYKNPFSIYDKLITSYEKEKIPYRYNADEDGNETERIYYDEATGEDYAVFSYSYKDGKISEIKVTEYMVNCDIHYVFDENEVIVSRHDEYDSGDYSISTYGEENRLVKQEVYKKTAEGINWYSNNYDENGNLIKTEYFDEEGKLSGYKTFEYNDSKLVISEKEYDAEGNLIA